MERNDKVIGNYPRNDAGENKRCQTLRILVTTREKLWKKMTEDQNIIKNDQNECNKLLNDTIENDDQAVMMTYGEMRKRREVYARCVKTWQKLVLNYLLTMKIMKNRK